MPSWAAKGKARDLSGSTASEGSGGLEGVVLPLRSSGSGTTDIVYSLDVKIGPSQTFSLQVDTGSSDLWVTSQTCTTTPCSQTNGHSYDPSTSEDTGEHFKIDYLSGQVEGPIVWDRVEIGGYEIENQAFAAADTITNEPLSPEFNGILGLALPLNSIIAGLLTPVTTNAPDGAAWASNLFSITPTSSAPGARFLSLLLSRPGDDRVPSMLGIGRHPEFITAYEGHTAPSSSTSTSSTPATSTGTTSKSTTTPSGPTDRTPEILYDTLVSDKPGILYWKVGVRAITVYVDSIPMPVEVGRGGTGSVFPSAILDSGVPVILTTRDVANGVYGALGIGPGSDGQYYVPCSTPLNLTITLDDRPEIPLHPLDLTTEPPKDNAATYCIGLIQAADPFLGQSTSVGDMILGVPFLRNVYTVMAYTPPNDSGQFPHLNASSKEESLNNAIRPRLGLLSLTDPTAALDDFHRVRVLNQPITNGGNTGKSNHGPGDVGSGRKGLSVGIIVLISLLAFFAMCFGLFALRWWFSRRKYRTGFSSGYVSSKGGAGGGGTGGGAELTAFGLAAAAAEAAEKKRRHKEYMRGGGGGGVGDVVVPTEDTMRDLRYEAYMEYNQANHDTESGSRSGSVTPAGSNSHLGHAVIGGGKGMGGGGEESDRSMKGRDIPPPGIGVGMGAALAATSSRSRTSRFSEDSNEAEGSPGHGHSHSGTGADELGYKPVRTGDTWWGEDTLVNPTSRRFSDGAGGGSGDEHGFLRPDAHLQGLDGDTLRPSSYPPTSNHVPLTPPSPTHQRSFSAAVPLLDAVDGGMGGRRGSGGGFDEFGVIPEEVGGGMAGVGTAARNSQRLGGGLRRESYTDSMSVNSGFGRTTSR